MRTRLLKQVSASTAEAFAKCTASHILPQHDSYQDYTEKGSDGHALLCGVVNRVPGAAGRLEAELPGLHAQLAEIMDGVEEATGEDAFVVDVENRTSLYLGRNIGRQYVKTLGRPLSRYEIPCSLDVKGRKNGMPWIRDFKFGITSSWSQLHIQSMAVMWSDTYDTEVDAGFIFIEDHDEVISTTTDEAIVYMVDLDMHADTYMEAFQRADELEEWVNAGNPLANIRVVEGKWCKYCGAFPHCPAKWKLAKSMLSLDIVDNIAALTSEQCGEAWLKLAEIKKNIIKKTEEALRERMRNEGGFPLASLPGKKLEMRQMPGRLGFDREGAIDLMVSLGVSDETLATFVKRGDAFDSVRTVNIEGSKRKKR